VTVSWLAATKAPASKAGELHRVQRSREPLFSVAKHGLEDFAKYKVWGRSTNSRQFVRRASGFVQTGFWEMMTKVPDRVSANRN